MQLNLNSRVHDLYSHPLGRDIIDKLLLQMGQPDWPIDKLSSHRLKSLKNFAGRKVNPQFFNAILDVINAQPDIPSSDEAAHIPAWWKEAVFYQVCPRSFTQEGIQGLIRRLDYLKALGITALSLTPVYDTPGGYNSCGIRDYYSTARDLGTLYDMDALIAELHRRGMKLVMDMVVNHTSHEHIWFQEALRDERSPYRDFYIFRKGRGSAPPNNWTSPLGGPAWEYYPHQDIWALCLFSNKQMDLNWESPALRHEIHRIVRWWLAKGVDGFILDVVNYISKYDGLPDGDEFIGELMQNTGMERYFFGPRLHEYLRELKYEVFIPYNAVSVGEALGIGPMAGRLLTDAYRDELDLILSTDHLDVPGKTPDDDYEYDLMHLKNFYVNRLNLDEGHGWHTLFFNKPDSPRMLSKIDPAGEFTVPLAKLLAVLQMTLRGTPFIFQGDEIGTCSHGGAMMEWDEVDRQQDDQKSILQFYRRLLEWRKKTPACIYGALEFMEVADERLFCYCRMHEEGNIFVEANLRSVVSTSANPQGAIFVMGNYRNLVSEMQPYEVRVYVY